MDKSSRKSRILRALARPGGTLSMFLATHGLMPMWGALEHTGRRSGKAYRSPVTVLSSGDLLILPVPFGGASHWPRNILAGGARVRWRGEKHELLEPRLAQWPEVRPLVSRPVRAVVPILGIRHFVVARRGRSA